MAVMRRAGHRHGGDKAQAADKILSRITVEDETVHDAQMIAAGIGIKPHGEGQQAAPRPCMNTLYPDNRAHRAFLFDRHPVDPAGQLGAAAVFGCIINTGDERERPHHLPIARPGTGDRNRTAARNPPACHAADDLDHVRLFADHDARLGRRGPAGCDVQGRGLVHAGGQRVRRPFERPVGPGGERPVLGRKRLAVAAHRQWRARLHGPARPGHAEGLAKAERGRFAVDPTDRRAARHRRCGAGSGGDQRGGAAHQAGAQHVAAADGQNAGHCPLLCRSSEPGDREFA